MSVGIVGRLLVVIGCWCDVGGWGILTAVIDQGGSSFLIGLAFRHSLYFLKAALRVSSFVNPAYSQLLNISLREPRMSKP
jgi:hypothetical protein